MNFLSPADLPHCWTPTPSKRQFHARHGKMDLCGIQYMVMSSRRWNVLLQLGISFAPSHTVTLLSNMHPSRKQRLFFIFLVMKMAKYRKIRYRSRFRSSCHIRDGQYRLQNNTNLLACQDDRPSKFRFSHPMALIFLKPPHFHQYPHYINVIEIVMIIMMVL